MDENKQNDLLKNESSDRFCTKCGKKLQYSVSKGIYHCDNCGYEEKDTFGKIKTILDINPNLSKPELAMIVDIPLKELNKYFDNNNYVVNPKAAAYSNKKMVYVHVKNRSCPYCGAFIHRIDPEKSYVCPKCGHEEESDFKKVKDFLFDHGSAPANIISQATRVPLEIIEEFLENGKIEITEENDSYLKCKVCGKAIRSGQVCATCSTKELKKLKGIYADQDQTNKLKKIERTKFRFIDIE